MTITINRLPGYGEPIVLDMDTLVGADLRGAELTAADLTGADLRGTNLFGADLIGSVLIGADLTEADLTGAVLIGADLTEADLTGANLTGTALRRTTLRRAKIYDDTIASLLTRVGRSDDYEFLAFRLTDGSTKIKAGCRWMTPDEYRAHVAAEYPNTAMARETLDIIEFIERRARR